jgi:alpha-1,2-mannosyltransferase
MKVAVIHSSLNQWGGAERLCMTMINALQKAGNNVTLGTVDRTNWHFLEAKYDLAFRSDQELFMIPNELRTASMSWRVALTLFFFTVANPLLKLKGGYDLLINTSGEVMNLGEDIAYINAVPMRAAYSYPEVLPFKNPCWRLISKVYDLFSGATDKINRNTVLLTNSRFNEAIIKKSLGRHTSVIYPPVEVKRFEPLSENKKRQDLVITMSRFRPGKNLGHIPKVARVVGHSRFMIMGPSDRTSETTINEINQSARKLGVQNRIELLTNSSQIALRTALSKAKVLLHTQFFEAFGMSIVEAMAAGCVPVVPREGGPWFDILEEKEGVYGFSYKSISEAAEKTRMLLENDELRNEISARAHKRAMDFDSSVFEENILDVVNKVRWQKLQ